MPYKNDKKITKNIPGFRRILNHLTPSRNDAAVYFRQTFNLSKTLRWIDDYNKKNGTKLNFLHIYLLFAGKMLVENEGLNRYVAGSNFYQRDGVTVSVSAKKKLQNGAKIVLLKLPISQKTTIESLYQDFSSRLTEGRSQNIHQEKEVDLFLKLPSFVLSLAIKLIRFLDRRHWLPSFFVDPDPMFSSLIVGNLGSVGLNAAYHHLYEYGNCPFFAVIGKIYEKVSIEDGEAKSYPALDVKYSFDERIEDGLACAIGLAGLKELIEDPDKFEKGITNWGGRPPSKT